MLVVGSRLKLINQFDNGEVLTLTTMANRKLLQMKEGTLDLLILNNFEKHRRNNFFQSFEILNGMSICDISLGNLHEINKAIHSYKQ